MCRLFVEELTKSILESDELTETGDHYEYAGKSHSVTIPATLRDSLMARLDRFMPVKEIAQIGAAIGREFGYELISVVATHSKERNLTKLSGLAQIVMCQGRTAESLQWVEEMLDTAKTTERC